MASKKPKERCTVCGAKATGTAMNTSVPICDNVACHHALIEEVNKELKELSSTEVAYVENNLV